MMSQSAVATLVVKAVRIDASGDTSVLLNCIVRPSQRKTAA
jgi:hypothetical protein